jgi:hypothetical protein
MPTHKGGAPAGHPAYNTQSEGGHPVKYTAEFIEAEAEALEKWMKQPDNIYFKQFAIERGYHPQRFSEFAEVNQRFSEALETAKEWQECRLVIGGLKGEFNAGFCKFVMGRLFGWAEKSETKVIAEDPNSLAYMLKMIDGKTKELVEDKHN